MQIVIGCLCLLAAHYNLTAFTPARAGGAWLLWPWAADARPVVHGLGGLPGQLGSVVAPLLAGMAGLGFLAAAVGMMGAFASLFWWRAVVALAAVASILLHGMFLGRWSLAPLALDAALLWVALAAPWLRSG
jgi:hypothetical protein